MSAATYFLTTHPDVMDRAMAEVRKSYATNDEISLHHEVQTPYVQAVLEETLRLFPAAPAPSPRVINKDGEVIDGRYIPHGVNNQISSHVPPLVFLVLFLSSKCPRLGELTT